MNYKELADAVDPDILTPAAGNVTLRKEAAAVLRAMADAEPVAWEHHASKLVYWLHCMSYNDSYFGEPAGLVKQVTGELNRLMRTPNNDSVCLSTPQRPQWMGLTDEEIDKAQTEGEALFRRSKYGARGQQLMPSDSPDWWFARAIEAALRVKNGGAA